MTDLVYIPTPSEDGPRDGRIVYALHAFPNIDKLREANITHWLKPVPLSSLIGEKDKEIEFLKAQVTAYKNFKNASEKIVAHQSKLLSEAKTVDSERDANAILTDEVEKLQAELSSLKSRVLEMAGDIFDAGVLREREQNLYPFGRNAGQYQYPDKSTYINNLKKELNIQS